MPIMGGFGPRQRKENGLGRPPSAQPRYRVRMCLDPDQLHDRDPLDDLLRERTTRPVMAALGLRRRALEILDAHTDPSFERPPGSEEEAVRLVIALRWPFGWRCDRCAHTSFTLSPSRPRQARCTRCARRRSVTSGTALQKKHDLCRWFAASMVVGAARQGSAHRFARAWGCMPRTALLTFHLLRRMAKVAPVVAVGPKDEPASSVTRCRPDAYDLRRALPRNHNAPPGRPLELRRYIVCTPTRLVAMSDVPFRVHRVVGPPRPGREAGVHALHLRRILHRVHRTVSPRWHHRYLCALAWRSQLARTGTCPRRAFVAAALHARCLTYAALAPP